MLSHGNLLHNVESCRQVLETVDVDRLAVLLPMFHSYMLTVGMLPAAAGRRVDHSRQIPAPASATCCAE